MHTIIFAYGRNIYSLPRSGYFPQQLSLTLLDRKTPSVAQVGGTDIGNCVTLLIKFGKGWLGKEAKVGAVLLNLAVFGAAIDTSC